MQFLNSKLSRSRKVLRFLSHLHRLKLVKVHGIHGPLLFMTMQTFLMQKVILFVVITGSINQLMLDLRLDFGQKVVLQSVELIQMNLLMRLQEKLLQLLIWL